MDREHDDGQLWGELREVAKGVAVLQTEVAAIHRRLDEIGGHIQTREMCEERSHTVGLRFADHEARIKELEVAGVADHEERLKALEAARASTPARVLWILFSAVAGVVAGAVVGKM